MGRSKRKQEGHESSERWLLTYADLITLLMAFFIIMYAMSNVDSTKYEALAKSLRVALGFEQAAGLGMISDISGINNAGKKKDMSLKGQGKGLSAEQLVKLKNDREEREFDHMVKQIEEYASSKGIENKVMAERETRGVVVNLTDAILFEPGKADLSPEAKQILDGIAGILFASNKHIKVEGHTDNVPIHNERYPSNWQLSTDRATGVIMYWLSKNPDISHRLSASGYGEHRPMAANSTPEGRAINRRVEIIVLKDIVSQGEPGEKEIKPVDTGDDLPAKKK